MNKGTRSKSVGFGLQRDITEEGAVILLRITNPRRLDVKALGEILIRYLRGGYQTLVLDQGKPGKRKMSLLEFLGKLQASYNESRYLGLERKLKRDTRYV